VADSSEHCNEQSDSTKGANYFVFPQECLSVSQRDLFSLEFISSADEEAVCFPLL
jgi:hypothetical protein